MRPDLRAEGREIDQGAAQREYVDREPLQKLGSFLMFPGGPPEYRIDRNQFAPCCPSTKSRRLARQATLIIGNGVER